MKPESKALRTPADARLMLTFALSFETVAVRGLPGRGTQWHSVVTGMGLERAEQSVRRLLETATPYCVITSGLAGGLNPELPTGTVLFDADPAFPHTATLPHTGARRGRFHTAESVVATPGEKLALRERTLADAVDMESSIIRQLCRQHRVPAATVRAVSDSADRALPPELMKLMDDRGHLQGLQLLRMLARRPSLLHNLVRVRRDARLALSSLRRVLGELIEATML